MCGVILASASGETAAFLVIGVLGTVLSAAVYLLPGVFDAASRLRLRMQGLPDDDKRVLERDQQRRRFIAMVLGIFSAAVLVTALTRL
jgi:TctA family transporter